MGDNKVIKSYQTAEFGKFVEIQDNTKFPPVSVVRWSYPDQSNAFPGNTNALPLSSIEIYPKYSVLTTITNPEDISISLSAGNLNVNLGDVENLLIRSNAIVSTLSANNRQDFQDVKNLVSTINSNVSATNTRLTAIVNQTDIVETEILDLQQIVFDGFTNSNSNTNILPNYIPPMYSWLSDIRNSLLVGIGGYSIGGYLNSYHLYLSSIDGTLKSGLNVTGGGGVGGVVTDAPVKKLSSSTLINTFTAPSANRIYNIFGLSTAGIGQYIQIYDIPGSTPTGTPAGVFYVPANSNFNFEFVKGIPFTNDKALIVNSLTPIDYNSGNSDLFLTVIYN